MLTKTTAEWLDLSTQDRYSGDSAAHPESLLEDPHLVARGFFRVVEHPTEGRIREMAIPSRWSGSEFQVARPAPRLGEHSREVLREAGLTDDEIDGLIKARTTIAAI